MLQLFRELGDAVRTTSVSAGVLELEVELPARSDSTLLERALRNAPEARVFRCAGR